MQCLEIKTSTRGLENPLLPDSESRSARAADDLKSLRETALQAVVFGEDVRNVARRRLEI